MPYHSRFQFFGPVECTDSSAIHLPEQLRRTGQTRAFCGHVMRLAEKVRQRKSQVKSRISDVNHFIIEQNQFVLEDECVLRAEIAVNQTVSMLQCFLCQRIQKGGRFRGRLGCINVVRLQAKGFEVGGIGEQFADFRYGLRRSTVYSSEERAKLLEMI